MILMSVGLKGLDFARKKMKMTETRKYPDIYSEVAKRTGKDRNSIKWDCMGLFYGSTPLPKDPDELIDYLVDYINSVSPIVDAVFGRNA